MRSAVACIPGLAVTWLLCCLVPTRAYGSDVPLKGIVNKSYCVIEFDTCKDAVRLGDVVYLPHGQHVVLIQTHGSYRTPIWSVVDTTHGDWVHLLSPLPTQFDVQKGTQLTTVVSAQSLSLNHAITCAPWDGRRGGIIAFDCADTLYVNNVIDASARGFRGGLPGVPHTNKLVFDSAHPPVADSQRRDMNLSGEGIERLSARRRASTTVVSQGGGRGGLHNGGGGGGGNAMAGGRGGTQCSAFDTPYEGGLPGNAVAVDETMLEAVMGGGGGAGQQNDHADARGGNGGGLVLIRARVIASNSGIILSRGEAGQSTFDDGAGGGGAGGTVAIESDTVHGNLLVDVSGGTGGSTIGYLYCYGAGAGGSGGRLIIDPSTKGFDSATAPADALGLLASIETGTEGGLAGVAQSNATCRGDHIGGVGGRGEVLIRKFPVEVLRSNRRRLLSVANNPICPGEIAYIILGFDTIVSVDTIATLPLYATQWFTFPMRSADGCAYLDSVQVRVRRIENLTLRSDTSIASGDSIVLTVPLGYQDILWSSGESARRCVIRDSGLYWVSVRDSGGCVLRSDTMHVSVYKRRTRVYVSVANASARPGDNVVVVMRARVDEPLSSPSGGVETPVEVKGVLSSNLSLLVPNTQPYARNRSVSPHSVRNVSHVPFKLKLETEKIDSREGASISKVLTYQCALGDADSSMLYLDSLYSLEADVIVEHHGVFYLEGVCRAGGRARLFDPWGGAVDIERVSAQSIRVLSDADVLGVYDMLGKQLNVSERNEGKTALLTFADTPPKEVFIMLASQDVVHSVRLWLR